MFEENDTFELKYAPRECKYFCCGDCYLPNTNRSCGTDKDDCVHYWKYKLQQSQQKLEIATEVLLEVSSNEYDNYDIYDDEFEKQVNYLTSRANKALTKIKEVK